MITQFKKIKHKIEYCDTEHNLISGGNGKQEAKSKECSEIENREQLSIFKKL